MPSRGARAQWLLKVQVGNQAISSFMWAVDSTFVDVAKQMLADLLTFRADREAYYYGMEDTFTRHPDIIPVLCKNTPTLLPSLFDGLVGRSRHKMAEQRRVHFYCKYLVKDQGGKSRGIRVRRRAGVGPKGSRQRQAGGAGCRTAGKE